MVDEGDGTEEAAVEAAVAEDAEYEFVGAADLTVLPDTDGAPLFTLGASVLLVGGGLLASRIF